MKILILSTTILFFGQFTAQCVKLYVKEHLSGSPICQLSEGDYIEICEDDNEVNGCPRDFYVYDKGSSNGNFTYELSLDKGWSTHYMTLMVNTTTKRFGFILQGQSAMYSYYTEAESENLKKGKIVYNDGERELTIKDNLWYSGEELYTGEVITVSQDQIETRYSVEKGVPSGLFTKYFLDNTFKKANYKDTTKIRRLNQAIVSENNELSSLIKDTLLAYNELISYIDNEIGGDKKLQKLLEKAQANKLKEKQKVLVQALVAKKTAWKNAAQNVLLSQQKIKLTNTKLKEEEAKPVVAPKIAEQYEQVNSIKNGSFKSYYNDGKLKSEGTFLNGLYNGAWTYYYSNGNVQAKGSFISGDGTDISETSGLPRNGRDGFWIFKHDNGKINQEANYIKGKLNGSFKEYNVSGIMISETSFINGIADGDEKLYYDSGKLKASRTYKQGKLDGATKTFYENGNLEGSTTLIKGNENGLHKEYFENGKIKLEFMMKNNKQHGSFKSYYESGMTKHKATIDTTSLADYNYIGEYYEYNEDGSIKTKIMAYKDGRTEDLTPKPEPQLSKKEMAKVYRCKCCKSNINGIMEGVDEKGESPSTFWLELYLNGSDNPTLNSLYEMNNSITNLTSKYTNYYDRVRYEQFKFCSIKCARTCY